MYQRPRIGITYGVRLLYFILRMNHLLVVDELAELERHVGDVVKDDDQATDGRVADVEREANEHDGEAVVAKHLDKVLKRTVGSGSRRERTGE